MVDNTLLLVLFGNTLNNNNNKTNNKMYKTNKFKRFNVSKVDNIYILKSGDLIKVGFSDNINQRLNQYLHHNPTIELLGTYYIEDGRAFEANFHNSNKSIIGNEWYDISMLSSIKEQIIKEVKIIGYSSYFNNLISIKKDDSKNNLLKIIFEKFDSLDTFWSNDEDIENAIVIGDNSDSNEYKITFYSNRVEYSKNGSESKFFFHKGLICRTYINMYDDTIVLGEWNLISVKIEYECGRPEVLNFLHHIMYSGQEAFIPISSEEAAAKAEYFCYDCPYRHNFILTMSDLTRENERMFKLKVYEQNIKELLNKYADGIRFIGGYEDNPFVFKIEESNLLY